MSRCSCLCPRCKQSIVRNGRIVGKATDGRMVKLCACGMVSVGSGRLRTWLDEYEARALPTVQFDV